MGKRKKIFKPGDRVWFEINGAAFDGTVVDDNGGVRVSIDVDDVGIVDIFHTILSPDDEACTQ